MKNNCFLGRFLILFFCLLCFNTQLKAQSTTVIIKDKSNQSILSNAIVRIATFSAKQKDAIYVSDKNGECQILESGKLSVRITYLGYQVHTDTLFLEKGGVYPFYLEKINTTLDDIVVTGQYNLTSTKASVYEVKVINEQDFRKKGANNLREALLGDLNIDMAQDNVFGSGLSIRGVSGEGVKIMVDGVPVVGRLDGKLDLSQINLSNIQRVEIIKGPMSVVYGTDAMGGVINLISKQNATEKWGINLKGYYESVGQYNASLTINYNLKNAQISVGGGRNFFDGYSIKDTARHKEWRAKEQYFADAKYTYTSQKMKIAILGSFFRELMIDRGNLRPYTTYAFDQHFLTYRPRVSLSATFPIKDLSKIDVLLAYSGFIRYYNNYKKDLTTLEQVLRTDETQDTTKYNQITARATYNMNTVKKNMSVLLGIDINQESTIQQRIKDNKQQIGDYAAFASIRIKPIASLDIQPAVRFAYNTKFRSPLIPSINIKWDAAKFLSVRLSYGMGYRAPSLKELYLSFLDSNHNLNGNEDLKPEKGHNGNATLVFSTEKEKHKISVSTSLFVNYITNKIDFAITNYTSAPVTYKYFNLNKYLTYGNEIKFDYSWKRVNASAGATFVQYTVTNTTQSVTNNIMSPDFVLTASYKIPYIETSLNFNYKYTGKKILYSLNSSIETGYRSPFHGLDISLMRNFWKDRIQLTIGGKNLLNVTNVASQNVSGVGHNFDPNTAMVNWGRTFFTTLNFYFAK